MTKQEIQKRIEELQNKINELREAVKKVKNTCFSRGEEGDTYCIIDSVGHIRLTFENGSSLDQTFYDVANYCTDQDLMKKRTAEETLSRLIWREAETANAKDKSKDDKWYEVWYNPQLKLISGIGSRVLTPGVAKFNWLEDAENCIRDVVIPFVKDHPELGWELEEQEEE